MYILITITLVISFASCNSKNISIIGAHLNIGDDYITMRIGGSGEVTIEKFDHIKSYYLDLPARYQHIIIKKLN